MNIVFIVVAILIACIYPYYKRGVFGKTPRATRCTRFIMFYHDVINEYGTVLNTFDHRITINSVYTKWAVKISYEEIKNNWRPLKLSEFLTREEMAELKKYLPYTNLYKQF